MNKQGISTGTITLLSVITIIIAGILYYFFIYVPTSEKMNEINVKITELDEQIQTRQAEALKLKEKETEINLGKQSGSMVCDYDSADGELSFLSGLMQEALSYDFVFSEPVTKDGIYVRRNVSVSFSTAGYAAARSAINKIIDSPYRTIFKNFTLTPAADKNVKSLKELSISGSSKVNVTADLIFIESCKDIKNRAGLKDLSPAEEYEKNKK